MRKMVVNVVLGWTLFFPALALAQTFSGGDKPPAKPAPSSLEDLLAKALQNNADIRVAESKIREADALLNRTRLEVMQKVVKLYHEVAMHKALVTQAQARLDRMKELMKNSVISREDFQVSEFALQQAKANLAKAEAEMPFLIGTQSLRSLALSALAKVYLQEFDTKKHQLAANNSDQMEKIRAVLNSPVQGEFTADKLLKLFREKAKGINLHTEGYKDPAAARTLHLTEPVPLGAALQWLEDTSNFRFVFRPYGIVLANREHLPLFVGDLLLNDWKNPPRKTTGKGH